MTAITATDSNDDLFADANPGAHVAIDCEMMTPVIARLTAQGVWQLAGDVQSRAAAVGADPVLLNPCILRSRRQVG